MQTILANDHMATERSVYVGDVGITRYYSRKEKKEEWLTYISHPFRVSVRKSG